MLININGDFVSEEEARLPLNDAGLLFGDSLFETIRVEEGHACWVSDHLDRLCRSADRLGIGYNRLQLLKEIERTARMLEPGPHRLRLTLTRGPLEGLSFPKTGQGHWFIVAQRYTPFAPDVLEQGLRCCAAPNQRVNPLSHLPQMKHGNYADCLYARNFALTNGFDEALFLNEAGEILEGATTNLFIAEENGLITPPLGSLVLGGVYRTLILREADRHPFQVREEPITLQRLLAADGAFLTNALSGAVPISHFGRNALNRSRHWSILQDVFRCG